MRLAIVNQSLSSAPILAAFESYRGSIIDLDTGQIYGPATMARHHAELGHALVRAGMQPGERVVMAIGNGPLFVCLLTAILARGGSPLLVHVKTPAAELRRYALRFGASWIVCDGWSADELMAAEIVGAPLSRSLAADCLWSPVDSADPSFESRYPSLPGVPLHPTSGTTGVPKIAVRPGPAAIAEADHYIATIGIDARDTILVASPMSHAYAYGMGVMVPLASGANIVSTRNFEAAAVRKALVELGVTILPAVPAMLDLLMFGAGDRLRGAARCVLTAGAPLPERTARRFFECAGQHVRPLYGTTETGGISVGPADHALASGGYVGPPMDGVEAEERRSSADLPADTGVAKLYIRSSSMMAGYLGLGEIDTAPLDDGWFLTGDLATRDAEGGIYLKGRHNEVINVGGLKVIPCEVEDVIAAAPGVQEVKVYAGEDRNGRQFVKAAVVVASSASTVQLQAHCERELVYYKRPRNVIVLDRLPRTPSGKIIVGQLP